MEALKLKISEKYYYDDITTFRGFLTTLVREFLQNKQFEDAAIIAFYSLFMVLPVMLLSARILSLIPFEQLKSTEIIMNDFDNDLLSSFMSEIFSQKIAFNLFSTVSLVMVFVSTKAIKKVIDVANVYYNVSEKRNFLMQYLVAFLYLLLITSFTIIYNFVGLVLDFILTLLGNEKLTTLFSVVKYSNTILPLLIFAVFLMFFLGAPNKKIRFFDVIVGTLLSTVYLLIGSSLVIKYIQNYSSYSLIYGNAIAYIVILLSVYSFAHVLLISIKINSLFTRKRKLQRQKNIKQKTS
ncbi:MAG: YihY/virulence factor BrkB family protein [Mycoplasmatales bacterium]